MSITPTEPSLTSGSTEPTITVAEPVSAKIPPAVEHTFPDGSKRAIQVNFCKNPRCANYGVPASLRKYAHRKKAPTLLPGTQYTLDSSDKGTITLACRLCGEHPPLKSNLGISEEIARLTSAFLSATSPSCSNEACSNYGAPVAGNKKLYHS